MQLIWARFPLNKVNFNQMKFGDCDKLGFFSLQVMKTHRENVASCDQQFAGVAGLGQSGTQEVKWNFLGLCCFCSKSTWLTLLDNKEETFSCRCPHTVN